MQAKTHWRLARLAGGMLLVVCMAGCAHPSQRRFVAADPGPEAVKSMNQEWPAGAMRARKVWDAAPAVPNPSARSSFGFVNRFVKFEPRPQEPATLVVRYDPKELGYVVPHTLRLFRWDAQQRRYELSPNSGVNTKGHYVWGEAAQSGIYAPIGVNGHPIIYPTIQARCAFGPLIQSASPQIADRIRGRICQVILCTGDGPQFDEGTLKNYSEHMGFDDSPGGPIGGGGGMGLGNVCDFCFGMPFEPLPECDLFDPGQFPDASPNCDDFETELRFVNGGAPMVFCQFRPDCMLNRTGQVVSTFTVSGQAGSAGLVGEDYEPGREGARGEGLYYYQYQIHAGELVGQLNVDCITRVSIPFGDITPLDYDSNGVPEDAVVLVTGSLGREGPSSITTVCGRVTINFSPGICSGPVTFQGDVSFFVGMASRHPPRRVTATVHATTGENIDVETTAPSP